MHTNVDISALITDVNAPSGPGSWNREKGINLGKGFTNIFIFLKMMRDNQGLDNIVRSTETTHETLCLYIKEYTSDRSWSSNISDHG